MSIANEELNINDSIKEASIDTAAAAYFNSGNEGDLEAVVTASAKLIRYFIKLYGFGYPEQDLMQAGNEGVIKALKRYDPGRGASFATYAGNLISGEIRHCVRKEEAYYRPKTIVRLQEKIDSLAAERLSRAGKEPTLEELSKEINIREEGVREVIRSAVVSFDEVDSTKIANIRMESFKLAIEDRILLEQAFKKLSDLQKKIVHMIFYKDMTQVQTAEKLGINQRKVSRELAKGLNEMRKTME